ncbi:MAG TPA: hypothetical protein VI072_19300 [Polyangiaceae bacterium]
MPAPRLHTTPFALGSDGSLILNVASAFATRDIAAVIRKAQKDGRPLFIGVVLTASERRAALRRLDNASAETAAQLSGAGAKARGPRRSGHRAKSARARKGAP